jgi:hypothetical protein
MILTGTPSRTRAIRVPKTGFPAIHIPLVISSCYIEKVMELRVLQTCTALLQSLLEQILQADSKMIAAQFSNKFAIAQKQKHKPVMKLLVPSMGSNTHVYFAPPSGIFNPPSSPYLHSKHVVTKLLSLSLFLCPSKP